MNRFSVFAAALVALGTAGNAHAQVAISALESTYTQDFDTLANTAASSTMPTGWSFSESGSNANAQYSIGTGSGTTGGSMAVGAPQFIGTPQLYYRVTTRVEGPRDTVTVIQTSVLVSI